MRLIAKYSFFILLALAFIAAELCLNTIDPVGSFYIFEKNDFEKTRAKHPEPVYEKVIFGNSAIISAFIEGQSESGYINLGLLYGKITDLKAMLEQKRVAVSGEIVIALNNFTLMDTLPTNPTYIWLKRSYEPYAYFQRDRLSVFLTDWFNNVLEPPEDGKIIKKYYDLEKYLPYNVLTDKELDEKIAAYAENYWRQPVSAYKDNLDALGWLANYCSANNIRLRAVMMPWNDYAEIPETVSLVMRGAAGMLREKHGVEVLDWTDKFNGQDKKIYHDIGHLTYNYGAPIFTKELDKWLMD